MSAEAMNKSGEETLKTTARSVGELASMATHQIEESVSRGRARLAQMQNAMKDKTREVAVTTDRFVHENPWRTIGLAAVIGMAVGLLIRRR